MLVDIYTKDGNKSGQIELAENVFAVEPNEHAMHLSVVTYLFNQRQGTRKTKIRSEVSGGGKKPWKQKGRGTARSGSSRSPIWVGGGTIHGPKPQDYSRKLPKKLKQLARKSALSLRLSENNLIVVEDFTFDGIKTKSMAEVLKNLNLTGVKTLVMMGQTDENIYLSGRNIPKLELQPYDKISTYDILNHRKILLFKEAAVKINEAFNN
jgi:large subunit ribosomal protein L4